MIFTRNRRGNITWNQKPQYRFRLMEFNQTWRRKIFISTAQSDQANLTKIFEAYIQLQFYHIFQLIARIKLLVSNDLINNL